MNSGGNKALVTRFYDEMWNRWREETAREILHPDVRFRGSLGLETRGHDGFLGYMATIRRAFPDFHNRIDELVAEGDRVVARLTYTGTHEGHLFDVAPTSRRVSYAGAAFFAIEGARIRSVWVLGDLMDLMRQIGAVGEDRRG